MLKLNDIDNEISDGEQVEAKLRMKKKIPDSKWSKKWRVQGTRKGRKTRGGGVREREKERD